MDGCEQSRVNGLYNELGDGLEGMATLVVTQHPNGSITAAPCDHPEMIGLLTPETMENIERLHALAEIERRSRVA